MKKSSTLANKNAENSGLKDSHKKKILKALIDSQLTNKQIGSKIGIDYREVSKRTSELERDGEVFVVSELPTCVYSLTNLDYPNLNKAKYEERQFRRWQKKSKDFGRFLSVDLIEEITNLK